jgi:VCBS repeat protein
MPNGPLVLSYNFNAISPCFGDLDGDGLPDLVRGGSGASVWARMIPGTDPPEFEDKGYLSVGGEPIYHEFKPGDDTSFPFLYDWTKHGLLDLILGDGYGYVWYYKNVGTKQEPNFAAGEKLRLTNGQPLIVGSEPVDGNNFESHSGNRAVPAPGDYVGNGRTDLVISDADGEVFYFRNAGDGRFEPGVKIAAGADSRAFVYPVDWNQDGKLDVVVAWSGGPKLEVLLNQGVGADGIPTFKAQEITTCPAELPTPRPIAIDWDHDGQPDLLLASSYAHLHYAAHHFVEHGYVEAQLATK